MRMIQILPVQRLFGYNSFARWHITYTKQSGYFRIHCFSEPTLAAAMPLFLAESYLFSAIQTSCSFPFCGLKSIFTLYAIVFIGSLSNGKITKC